MRAGSLSVLAALVALLAVPTPADGVPHQASSVLSYPGAAPCDTTLQACIDAAAPGATIKITTSTPIDENLQIQKSLTLTAAPGVRPVIGTSVPQTRLLEVTDAGATAVSVAISHISFVEAGVSVSLYNHPNDHFALSNSSVVLHEDSNNADGVAAQANTDGSTVMIAHNSITSTGQPLDLEPGITDPAAHSTTTAVGNVLRPAIAIDAYHGITIDTFGTGHPTVNAYNNDMAHMYGCNCGGAGSIEIDAQDTVDSTVNLVGNTIDSTAGSQDYPALNVRDPSPTANEVVNIADNIISNSIGPALLLPTKRSNLAVSLADNDYFNNHGASDFGGYSMGFGNHALRPGYAGPGTGNYRLLATSPLIDLGQACVAGGLGRIDAGGHFRIAHRNVDIGAHEFDGGAPRAGRTIFGTGSSNTLTGSAGSDIICGFGGNDIIRAGGGKDFVFGGDGNDSVTGGDGSDWITGGNGADLLSGNKGNDHLLARDGRPHDVIFGGRGHHDVCRHDHGDTVHSCP